MGRDIIVSKKVLSTISVLTFSLSMNASASFTLEELAALSFGTSTGYKLAAQSAINSGGLDPWAASQGGNTEIYKNRIDPAAPNTLQAISDVKNTLAGNAGNSLLQDAKKRVTKL